MYGLLLNIYITEKTKYKLYMYIYIKYSCKHAAHNSCYQKAVNFAVLFCTTGCPSTVLKFCHCYCKIRVNTAHLLSLIHI